MWPKGSTRDQGLTMNTEHWWNGEQRESKCHQRQGQASCFSLNPAESWKVGISSPCAQRQQVVDGGSHSSKQESWGPNQGLSGPAASQIWIPSPWHCWVSGKLDGMHLFKMKGTEACSVSSNSAGT